MLTINEVLKLVNEKVESDIVNRIADQITGEVLSQNDDRIQHFIAETREQFNQKMKKDAPL
jgi:hypothetical protein